MLFEYSSKSSPHSSFSEDPGLSIYQFKAPWMNVLSWIPTTLYLGTHSLEPDREHFDSLEILEPDMDSATRRFHGDATAIYSLPNDKPEHSRLNGQAFHLDTVMSHRILQSPIESGIGKRMIDVGCGTGLTLCLGAESYVTDKIALQFPDADVFGLDLSPVPQLQGHPPNVHFLQGNVLNEPPTAWKSQTNDLTLTHDEEVFDFVYGRFLIAGINDWPAYIQQQFRLLKAGGWAEMHELDPLVYDSAEKTTTDQEEWHTIPEQAAGLSGPEYGSAKRAASRMKAAGFVDIGVQEYPLPLGGEGQTTPELQAAGEFFDRTFMDVREMILKTYVKDAQLQERLLQDMRVAMAPGPGKHCKLIVTFGRKPGSD